MDSKLLLSKSISYSAIKSAAMSSTGGSKRMLLSCTVCRMGVLIWNSIRSQAGAAIGRRPRLLLRPRSRTCAALGASKVPLIIATPSELTSKLFGIASASAIVQFRSGGVRSQYRDIVIHSGILIISSPRACCKSVHISIRSAVVQVPSDSGFCSNEDI